MRGSQYKNWRKVKLEEVANINMGQSPSSKFYNERGEGLPFFQGVTAFGEKYPQRSRYCSQPTKIASKGDILITVRAPVGDINIAIDKSCIGRGIAALSMKNGNNEFLYFLMKYYRRYFKSIAGGTTYEAITKKQLEKFEMEIPEDINEQRNIAKILSALDDKIELNSKINKTLEQMAQAIFKEWFVDFRFPSHYKVKFVDSELGKIPEDWSSGRLVDIAKQRKERMKNYEEWKNLKLIDIGRMPRKSLSITSCGKGEELKTSIIAFKKRDVLFGAIRAYFHKVVIAPFNGVTNSSVFVIHPKNNIFYSFLVSLLFSNKTIEYATKCSSGTKMPVIKWEVLGDMPIVIPDLQVVKLFEINVAPYYKKILRNVNENITLASLRNLLLPKLISGEIRV